MLDLVGAIVLTAYSAAAAGLVVGLAQISPQLKLKTFAAGAAWLTLVVGVYASGGLKPGLLGPVPVNFLPFTILLVILFGAWLISNGVRAALQSVPLAALIAANGGRLAGLLFFLLYLDDRLSAPFGPAAAFGDIITGAVALLLAGLLFAGSRVRRSWIVAWNVFGALDLLMAITLAALSAPGAPFQLFHDGSGTQVLAALPWIFAPAILVPLDFLLHFAIAVRLRTMPNVVEVVDKAQRPAALARA